MMKPFLLFFILIITFSYSQKKNSDKEIDSIAYYNNLSDSNVKEYNYKNALNYSQKAIQYSIDKKLSQSEAEQTYKLGKLYYDIKKYDDAINAFNTSLFLS